MLLDALRSPEVSSSKNDFCLSYFFVTTGNPLVSRPESADGKSYEGTDEVASAEEEDESAAETGADTAAAA